MNMFDFEKLEDLCVDVKDVLEDIATYIECDEFEEEVRDAIYKAGLLLTEIAKMRKETKPHASTK
ncbi:MAG: hypothetical protein WC248_05095 [Candidatus Methanomethylophilaceae archaeon]|jgi:DNA-binding SARP family transcriptional activator